MRTRLTLAATTILLAACATVPPGTARIQPNRITRVEILELGPCSAWEVVTNLRPIWLRKRGQTSFTQETDVVIYLDGTRMGYREALRQIHSDVIESMEFLDARRATVRFGSGHVNGAILVHTTG